MKCFFGEQQIFVLHDTIHDIRAQGNVVIHLSHYESSETKELQQSLFKINRIPDYHLNFRWN